MQLIFDAVVTLISLTFLGIVACIGAFAIPGLFIAALAPWLDWILPVRRRRTDATGPAV